MPGVNLPTSQISYYLLTLLVCGILHEVGHAVAAVRYCTGEIYYFNFTSWTNDCFLHLRKEMFYLTTHSTHFIYGYMASDIW